MPARSREDLAKQSRFAFRGTVQRLRATTIPGLGATDRTVVVRVDEVIHAPEALGDWTGKEITVQLGSRERVREGEETIFYTNGWLYGESIAVISIGHRPVGRARRALTAQAGDPVQALADRDLQARVASADLIVTGTVTAVRLPTGVAQLTADAAPAGPLSEHDPHWQEAVIQVSSTVKGDDPGQTTVVTFPSSTDVAWYRAPKFHPGDEGVFILHRGEVEQPAPARDTVLGAVAETTTSTAQTVVHPQDFQPPDKLDDIRALVAAGPG